MSKGKAPPPPDYTGAALAQAEASKENLNIQNYANRPTVNTPWGQESWSTEAVVDPATGQTVTQWTQNTTLNPELQAALDSQIGLQQQRSNLAEGFMGRVGDAYSQSFDWENLPQLTSAGSTGQLAADVADYSPGLATSVGQQDVARGFDFRGPQMGVNDFVGNIQQGVSGTALQESVDPLVNALRFNTRAVGLDSGFNANTDAVTTGVNPQQVNTGFNANTGNIQSNVDPTQVTTAFSPMTGDLARTTQGESVQRQLALRDNPAMPAFDASYRDSIAQDLVGRMLPVHQMQQQTLETQLANQGFQKGTEAYKRAFDDLANRQASERYNALDIAGNEAQRLFGMQMGQRQQAFNEDVGAGNFANAASNQAFQMGLTRNQFQNQATQQAFNQDMAARQAGNQALGQQFGQNLQAAQFNNAAQNQMFSQDMAARQAANQAIGQQFGQNLQAANFGNAAQNQIFQQDTAARQAANAARNSQFQQGLAADQFANQAVGQGFGQLLGAGQFVNDAAGQRFNQNLAQGQFANQAVNQAFNQQLGAGQFANDAASRLYDMQMGQADLYNRSGGQLFQQDLAEQNLRNQALAQASAMDIARQQANNAAAQQQFQMNMQAAEQQNRMRQQAIAEQQLMRAMPLNEMNALLTGQQVGMPQMPGFQAAGVADTPQLLNAANMQYNAALDAQNARNAGLGNTMSGLFSLGSAALGNPFAFSDRRLKRNIKRVGTHSTGVGLYEYYVAGYRQRGVIAQELEKVRPDLVRRHSSGYLTVNYGAL
jgi:hypothetical protein